MLSSIQLFNDLQTGISIQDELETHYKKPDGSIDADQFIGHFKELLARRNEVDIKKLTFTSIQQSKISQDKKEEIIKIGSKVLFGGNLKRSVKSEDCDAFIEKIGPNILTDKILERIANNNHDVRFEICKAIKNIEPEEITSEAVEAIVGLYDGLDSEGLTLMKVGLINVPIKEQISICNSVKNNLSMFKTGTERFFFIQTIRKLSYSDSNPQKFNQNIVDTLKDFIKGSSEQLLEDFDNTIDNIDPERRAAIIELALPLIEKESYDTVISGRSWDFTNELNKLDKDAFVLVKDKLKEVDGKDKKAYVIDTLKKYPKSQWSEDLVKSIVALVKKTDLTDLSLNLNWLFRDPNQKIKFPQDLLYVLQKFPDLEGKNTMIIANQLWNIPDYNKETVIAKTIEKIKILDQTHQQIPNNIVETISLFTDFLPPKLYEELSPSLVKAEQVIDIFKNEKHRELCYQHILDTLETEMSPNDKLSYVDKLLACQDYLQLDNSHPIMLKARTENLLCDPASGIPEYQKETIRPIFLETIKQNNPKNIFEILKSISIYSMLITPELFKELSPSFVADRDETLSNIFKNEKYRDVCYQHILEALDKEMSASDKLILVELIFEYQDELHLHDEHPIMQRAQAEAFLCDPDALEEPKNPYKVLNDLREVAAKEPLVEVNQTPVNIHGESLKWNINTLREKGSWEGHKFKELPTEVTPTSLHDLFAKLDARLTGEDKAKIEEKILAIRGKDYEFLKNSLLGTNSILPGLLKRKGKPDERVSETQFELFAIMKALLNASDKLKGDALLTEQEEKLLGLAFIVQNCDTGQGDGIAVYYNGLSASERLGGGSQESSAAATVEEFFAGSVKKTLEDGTRNEAFLKEITGETEGDVKEGVHVTTYFKNRFHKQIGYRHLIKYDPHTDMLYDSLFMLDTKNTVDNYFKHVTPKELIRQTINDSEAALKEKHWLGMVDILEKHERKKLDFKDYFEIDDKEKEDDPNYIPSYEPIRLTEKGAITLMKALGYLL